MKNKYSASST